VSTGSLVDLAAIRAAREVIAGRVHRTPLLWSTAAATQAGRVLGIHVGDDRLYLKAEHLQKTGSFKSRGMTARVAALSADGRRRGIITVSAGNAAQGYAYAGRRAPRAGNGRDAGGRRSVEGGGCGRLRRARRA